MSDVHPFWILGLTASIAFVPLLAAVTTSYLKMSIVLGLIRSGLGTQQVPGNLVTMTLALGLSLFVMGPVFQKSFTEAAAIKIAAQELPRAEAVAALRPVVEPWLAFARSHAGSREQEVLMSVRQHEMDHEADSDQDIGVLLPAFILTELKEAFAMGFVLLLPFLVIDLVVANVLVGLGMFMVSPVMISLPLKLLLFVVADGWLIVSKSLILSYRVG